MSEQKCFALCEVYKLSVFAGRILRRFLDSTKPVATKCTFYLATTISLSVEKV